MKLRVLLVNPWIYDFAAASLWSRPFGLLKVAERLSVFDIELSLIDCTDVCLKNDSGRGKYPKVPVEKPGCLGMIPRTFGRYGISPDDFRLRLSEAGPFDIVFVTSIMSWWYPGVRQVIEIIRETNKSVPVVLGGIYATLWHRHASENSGADFIFTGPAEDEMKVVFNTFGFRSKRISEAASPYYRLGLYPGHRFEPLLSSTGCPFSCSYCASKILSRNFSRRTPRDVISEIKELYQRGVRDFAFYDDALLAEADGHIRPILAGIGPLGLDARFHCPNGLHARFIDDDLAHLMKDAGFKTIRLGLETVHHERQAETGGKVRCEDITNAVGHLKKHGFTKKEIGVYLMYGLPGQALNEVREGVAFLMSLGVNIRLTEFSPIPGSKCWQDLKERGVVNDDIDPLLTNNTVFSYLFSGYDPREVDELKLRVKNYNMT